MQQWAADEPLSPFQAALRASRELGLRLDEALDSELRGQGYKQKDRDRLLLGLYDQQDVEAQAALGRPCGACNPVRNPLVNQGWWLEFGLDRNPYVYGPMPRLRTSVRYRLEEARRMGWTSWCWQDEYTKDRLK